MGEHWSNDHVAALVATELLRAAPEAIGGAVEHAFSQIAHHCGVERAYYYRLDESAGAFLLEHEWHPPERRAMAGLPQLARLPLDILPEPLRLQLRAGRSVRLPRTRGLLGDPVDDVVEGADQDRAILMVPVVLGGALLGVAGFAGARESTWDEGDAKLLDVVAQGVARAVERRRVDEAMRASEAMFRAMCDSSPLGIFLAGPGGDCRYINAAAQRICGLTFEQARGRGWLESLHPEDRARVTSHWGSAVGSRDDYATVHRFVHGNGDVRSVEVRAVPLRGDAGTPSFLGILEDVTERQRADVERRELLARAEASRQAAEAARADAEASRTDAESARAEVAAILSRISDAFIALDLDGRYRYVNDPAVAMIGRSRAELVGRRPWEAHPEIANGPFHEAYLSATREQRPVTIEQRERTGQRVFEVRLYPSATGTSVFAEEITARKRQEEQLASDREYLRQEVGGLDVTSDAAGYGEGLREVFERVNLVAAGNTSVLVTGETGTGKELVARAIHERSPRRERLLVKVNCAAISAGLVESELFGHEKGAFTGALARRKGRFELAHGGTLFLDEVGELPLDVQAKLLRILQERELERVGGSDTIRVDVRVIAATNRDLVDMVAKGRFREDLYYRLNVFPVALPPLRERAGDVPLLVHTFLRRFARGVGRRIEGVTPEAMQRLCAYRWPGNVRELQNVVERAVILTTGRTLDVAALPDLGADAAGAAQAPSNGSGRVAGDVEVDVDAPGGRPLVRLPGTIDEIERAHLARTLDETAWVIEGERGAARKLGLHPNTLRSRLKRYGLKRPPPRGDAALA
ncbi:MAG TPA: sigma 54-interacting transcriptional regulator [Polyangia bacterium]|nr:sigma 54-interacting transcriptional regulator [Polyangia bacterium]